VKYNQYWETSEVIGQLEKPEQTADMWHNVTFTHNSVHKIHNNSNRIKESAKSEIKCLCSMATVLSIKTITKFVAATVS